jgi:hypothetical protein
MFLLRPEQVIDDCHDRRSRALELVSAQNGSKVTGTGTLYDNSTTEPVTFSATSMASTVRSFRRAGFDFLFELQ